MDFSITIPIGMRSAAAKFLFLFPPVGGWLPVQPGPSNRWPKPPTIDFTTVEPYQQVNGVSVGIANRSLTGYLIIQEKVRIGHTDLVVVSMPM